ncbi:MAG: hypothetical protein SOY99_05710 [Alloprevotella sp.]|nr:hypothetical protein [Bacteroidales bacterium]MDY3943706.1 hypothetical protein [Alloprevotella sp.]
MEIKKNTINALNYAIEHQQELKQYADFYLQNKQLNLQIDQLNMINEVKLKCIAEKYETQRLLIERVFGERAFALRAQYDVLHKGLENNDPTIILPALKAISDTIAVNPLEQLVAYTHAIESDDEIMKLDF